MWDTFFKAPKLGCRGRGGGGRRGRSRGGRGGAALHMSLQIGMASEFMKKCRKKQEKKQQPLTRRGGGGRICEAATVWKGRAAGPPVCGAASCSTHTHTLAWADKKQEYQHVDRQLHADQTRLRAIKGFFSGISSLLLFLSIFCFQFFSSNLLFCIAVRSFTPPQWQHSSRPATHSLHTVSCLSAGRSWVLTPTSGALPVCGVAPPTIQRRALIGRRSSVSVDCLL